MKGNLYDRMFAALEWMDEGVEPVDYLYDRFSCRDATHVFNRRVMAIAFRVVEVFYANYW